MKKRRKTYAGFESRRQAEATADAEEQRLEMPASRKSSVASRKSSAASRHPTGFLGVEGDNVLSTTSLMGRDAETVRVKRPVYSQYQFENVYTEEGEEANLKDQFIDTVYLPPTPALSCIDLTFKYLPVLPMLRDYRFREFFLHDLLSGVTTGVMRIPQSMAYALLALVTPVHGLYTALVASLAYCLLGSSPHLVMTCQGVVSLLVGQVAKECVERTYNVRLDNITANVSANGEPISVDFVREEILQTILTITLIVGILQALFSVVRLGMLTNYLSDPLIGGFTTGAAIEIICSQVSSVVGYSVQIPYDMQPVGLLDNFKILYIAAANLPQANLYTMLISAAAVAFLAALKRANRYLKRLWKVTIPAELLVVLLSTLVSALAGLDRLGVDMVGDVPPGLPPFEAPKFVRIDLILLRDSVVIAVVAFAISVSMAKKFSLKYDNEIDSNQEFLAYGVGNIVGCFMGCFASTCSMTCTNLHESIGGRTQVANFIASVLVLVTLLFFGFFFASTPGCILSAIIIVNLRSVLWQFKDLPHLWRASKIDCCLWLAAFLAVVLVDANTGILLGIAFSLLTVIFRFQWPYACVLGRIEHTDIYKNVFLTPTAKEVEGIKIFRFEGPLFFSSADHFRRSLCDLTGVRPRRILLQRREYQRRLRRIRRALAPDNHGDDFQPSDDSDGVHLVGELAGWPTVDLHHIIIDMSCCSFIDSVGLKVFNQVLSDFEEAGVVVFLCNTRSAIRAMLSDAEISRVDKRAIFLTNHDAVCAAMADASRLKDRDWPTIFEASEPSYQQQLPQQQRERRRHRRHFVSRHGSESDDSCSDASAAAAPAAASTSRGGLSRDPSDPLLLAN